MYGFIGSYGRGVIKELTTSIPNRKDISKDFVQDEVTTSDLLVKRKTINKFLQDKIWYDSEKLFIAFEGVIYNLTELKDAGFGTDANEVVVTLFNQHGANFINYLNGTFSGVIIEKKEGIVWIYTSHIAYRPIYYSVINQQIVFSTDIAWIYDTFNRNNIDLKIDHDGAYCLLSMGYMLDDKTLVEGIHKVSSGEYVKFEKGEIKRINYWDINKIKEVKEPYDDLLKKADFLFCQAVRRLYDKDEFYNYSHVCTLSGGLDSRAIAIVANDLGYSNQTFVTFCESGMDDAKISSQIASDLRQEHFIYDLDNGLSYLDIDKAIYSSGGLIRFQGFMPTRRLCEVLLDDNCGLLHTGEIGDVVFGGSFNCFNTKNWSIEFGAYSKVFLDKISIEFKETLKKTYSTGKNYALINRGVNACELGWLASNCVTESSSAFIDKEFIEFMLSVPDKFTNNSRFYIDWMKKYHPQMCKYIWTTTNSKPGAPRFYTIGKRAWRKIKHDVFNVKFNLNPFDYWYRDGSIMKKTYDDLFDSSLSNLENCGIVKDCSKLYQNGSIYDKMLSLTLVRAINDFQIKL